MFTPLVDAILFDTKNLLPGGSGKKFDWNVLDTYDGEKPFLISGGIGPDDAEQIRRFIEEHPKCMGIDLNSCFEIAPGLKDVEKLRTFINSLKR